MPQNLKLVQPISYSPSLAATPDLSSRVTGDNIGASSWTNGLPIRTTRELEPCNYVSVVQLFEQDDIWSCI